MRSLIMCYPMFVLLVSRVHATTLLFDDNIQLFFTAVPEPTGVIPALLVLALLRSRRGCPAGDFPQVRWNRTPGHRRAWYCCEWV